MYIYHFVVEIFLHDVVLNFAAFREVALVWNITQRKPEMEPTRGVSHFGRAGSGRVMSQNVRPGVWPGFKFCHTRL